MIVGGDDDGVAGFWSSVGKELKAGGAAAARGAGSSAAGYVGERLTQASQSSKPPAPAPKPEGIPKGLLIAGSVVVGVGVIALLASRGGSKRATATNPRRRRRRRRRR